MGLEKNQLIVIGVVVILACAGVGAYLLLSDDSDGADLVFAVGNKDCYEPCWIADDQGYYSEFGVNVDTLTVSGGGKALEALLAGQADLAGFGSTPLVNCLNMNSTGDYVVVARWMGGESYAEMASTIFLGTDGKLHSYSLSYPTGSAGEVTVQTRDGARQVVMDPIKGNNVLIGLDMSTGYDAAVKKYCSSVGLTYAYSGEAAAATADIVMKQVEFALQVAALTQTNDVDGIIGGSYGLAAFAISNDVLLSIPDVAKYPSLESEASCCLIASMDAYVNKFDKIVGVLKALQKASCYIYGIEYTSEILSETYVKNAQAALTPAEKTALFGDSTASAHGYYYRTDACQAVADVFGYPFTVDVQRLSYDKYRWGLDFTLVDLKLIKNSYEIYKNADTIGKYRSVTALDYMTYFDGLALNEALKGAGGSSWDSDGWFRDATLYLSTPYTFTLTADSSVGISVYKDVVNATWTVQFLDGYGKNVAVTVDSLTLGGVAIPGGWTFDGTVLTFNNVINGNVVIKVTAI